MVRFITTLYRWKRAWLNRRCVVAQTVSLCPIRRKLTVCATERRTAKLTPIVRFPNRTDRLESS